MKKQRGFVTLGVSLVLVSLISMNAFMSSKGAIMEQQSVNNAYSGEQALQHAEKGLKQVQTNMNQYLKNNPSTTKLSDIPTNQTNLSMTNVYSTFINGNQLYSIGFVNGVGVRKVSQLLSIQSKQTGAAALNALGSITLGGSITATNIKAGGTITGKSLPSETYANNYEYKVALIDHNANALRDAYDNVIYRTMTSDEYFLYYFGGLCPIAQAAYSAGFYNKAADCAVEAKANIALNPKGYICNAADCGTQVEDNKIVTAYKSGKRIFWLNGGINNKTTMGTEADPVLIMVMNVQSASQAAKINANSTIFGVLYVDVLDSQQTIGCSCFAKATVTSIQVTNVFGNDTTKPIFTLTSSGGTLCSSNKGCTDSLGNVIPKGSRYVTTYQQKVISTTSAPVYGNFTGLGLNTPNPLQCSLDACSSSLSSASKTCTGGTKVGDAGTCSFLATAVSGTQNEAVQVQVLGTFNDSGTGGAVIRGALLTSANYNGRGNAQYIQNQTVITNMVLQGLGRQVNGFNVQPPTIIPSSWSDMNY